VRHAQIVGLLVIAAALEPATSNGQGAQDPRTMWRTPWSYDGATDGAARWGDLDPEYATCKTGKAQSPIDIRGARPADLAPLRFEYKSGPVRIINNGYTAVRVNYSPGNANYLYVGDVRYELTQFHFHRPSEEEIDGQPFDMVIHLMHKGSDGKLVGVAVPVREGAANSVVRQLWAHMPPTPTPEHEIRGLEVDPAGLIPSELSYYQYEGSVTAPPCTEGVTWFVLRTPVTVSAEQIAAFARLYPHDVRPVQPLNGRVVEASR
jgi:carbonic anhydrase